VNAGRSGEPHRRVMLAVGVLPPHPCRRHAIRWKGRENIGDCNSPSGERNCLGAQPASSVLVESASIRPGNASTSSILGANCARQGLEPK
jgi:hypothetical protein